MNLFCLLPYHINSLLQYIAPAISITNVVTAAAGTLPVPNTAPSPAPCNVLTAIFPTDFHGYYISVPIKTLYSRFWCFICHRFRITVLFL